MDKSLVLGNYVLEKNVNLDAFYAAAGVPWFARKMMLLSTPHLTVTEEEEDRWLFKTVTFSRTIDLSFKLDEEFEETLPSGDVFNTTAKLVGNNKILLESKSNGGEEDEDEDKGSFVREYDFSKDGLIMGKRYFKRIE